MYKKLKHTQTHTYICSLRTFRALYNKILWSKEPGFWPGRTPAFLFYCLLAILLVTLANNIQCECGCFYIIVSRFLYFKLFYPNTPNLRAKSWGRWGCGWDGKRAGKSEYILNKLQATMKFLESLVIFKNSQVHLSF